ncbi:hypothetical protein KP509_10G070400 [Ceratopteris richardii]|uniref:Uncharacterized protein n=1 Tax=Ceratopteris richardii TaxID=49495 RepID=A0A8T2U0G6_CERRI|nr:hypothetical protein KP509_10G070400 [Ceratopteris richardii]
MQRQLNKQGNSSIPSAHPLLPLSFLLIPTPSEEWGLPLADMTKSSLSHTTERTPKKPFASFVMQSRPDLPSTSLNPLLNHPVPPSTFVLSFITSTRSEKWYFPPFL